VLVVTTLEAAVDQDQVYAELDRVRDDYRCVLDSATVAELRQPTRGTKWINEQLLFHMLFGYLLARNLRLIVWGFSRLPDGASKRFAAVLNAGTRPFHVITARKEFALGAARAAAQASVAATGAWLAPVVFNASMIWPLEFLALSALAGSYRPGRDAMTCRRSSRSGALPRWIGLTPTAPVRRVVLVRVLPRSPGLRKRARSGHRMALAGGPSAHLPRSCATSC
jgi:hypothetical protein